MHSSNLACVSALNRRDTADLGQAAARLGRNTGLGQPNGAAELAGGHIHHHRVVRPLIGISTRRNPSRPGSGISCGLAAHPRALNVDPAAVKANPSPRMAPMAARHVRTMPVTLPGEPRHIFVHQPGQAFDACRQTELPEALRQFHKRMHVRGGRQSRGVWSSSSWRCFLSVSMPRARGSGEATQP